MRDEDVATLLNAADRPVEPPPAFAAALLDRLLHDLGGDGTVTRHRRIGTQRLDKRRRVTRLVVAATALTLLVTGVAAATYLARRTSGGNASPARYNGPLTLNARGAIVSVEGGGRATVVWRCAGPSGCGILNGIAWSRDGRRLAYVVPRWGRARAIAGLYVVDTATRRQRHLSSELTGCKIPYDPAWSPDGLQIAYACPSGIFVVGRSLSDPRRLDVGATSGRLSSPSWSADGTRLAFAVHEGGPTTGRNDVYVVASSGGRPRLLAKNATVPAWSPDGRTVAVRAGCGGIKLIEPDGRDVTPWRGSLRCRAIGVPGVPVWSPDGTKLAIQMRPHGGVFVLGRDGTHLVQLARRGSEADTGGGPFGGDRPAWRPTARPPTQPRPTKSPSV
jgi:Tol biopolymer transport system component